jgi:hypothetical protein
MDPEEKDISRHRLSKQLLAATNTHAIIEELSEALMSMQVCHVSSSKHAAK